MSKKIKAGKRKFTLHPRVQGMSYQRVTAEELELRFPEGMSEQQIGSVLEQVVVWMEANPGKVMGD